MAGEASREQRTFMMKDLVEYLATSLVEHPDQVRVRQTQGIHTVSLELHVAPEDMGKVIGRQGRIASAMRCLLRVSAAREGKRVNLDIV